MKGDAKNQQKSGKISPRKEMKGGRKEKVTDYVRGERGGEYKHYQDQEKIDDKKKNLPVSNSGLAPVMGQKIGGKNFENLDKNLMKNEIGNVGLNLCLIEDKNLQNKKKNLETETNLAEETKMKFEKTDILKKKETLKKTPTTPRNPKLVKTPGRIQKNQLNLLNEKGKEMEFFSSLNLLC